MANDENKDEVENEEFAAFISEITRFFSEKGIEIVMDEAKEESKQDFKQGFLLKGEDIPQLLDQFMEQLEEENVVVPVVTDDKSLVRLLETVKMFQEYQGLLPEGEDPTLGRIIRPDDFPDHYSAKMDALTQRLESGEEVSNEETTAALKELAEGMLTWMIETEKNPNIKKLMELMNYRISTGMTSVASDQAILTLFEKISTTNNPDNHVSEMGIAMHHMTTHHYDSSGALDVDVANTVVFGHLTGLLNTKAKQIHNWGHMILDCEPGEQHDVLVTMLLSLYIEGMMTGWYAAHKAENCLGAEMHGK